jgi:hypothetical protein
MGFTLGTLVPMLLAAAGPPPADEPGPAYFAARVRPLLASTCWKCHGPEKQKGGLRLDSRAAVLQGGEGGPAVVPGNPARSPLIDAIAHTGDLRMPPAGKLPPEQIEVLTRWVRLGAPWAERSTVLSPDLPASQAESRVHWSFEPIRNPLPPAVRDTGWAKTTIDPFILARLEAIGLRPAPPADRLTLIRRVTFDLTGLPPTPEEIDAFLEDSSPDAYEKVVERLLASPHYGERWGRHWLDVVRYAETEGFEYDRLRPGAWRYRDYVISSLNADKPFDRFVLEQLAGDELAPGDHELLIAAGFHRLGPVRRNAGNQAVAVSRNEVLTEMTDAIGSAFLGLTVGCARCHDHKFDPLPQADYYRLQAFLAGTHEHDLVLADPKTRADHEARSKEITNQLTRLQKLLSSREGKEKPAIREQIALLRRKLPALLPTISTIHNVPAERTPVHVLRRGDPEKKGVLVGPRPLGRLTPPDTPELPGDVAQPKTRLARWLLAPEHPLTARVFVNRVWQYHFGRGIVATPNDFGANGAPPSHPDLLDHLARAFVAGGWRLKPLHRLIVCSSTYRQSTIGRDPGTAGRVDPDDTLLWHFPRRRLSAEEVRDALLAVSGQLNPEAGGPSVAVPVAADLVDLLYDPAQWVVTADAAQHNRRSVYLLAKRNLPLPFFQAFDQPDAQTSCPRREASTHPLQALELLNGSLANRLARDFAERLTRECGPDGGSHAERRNQIVERGFRLAVGRPPSATERELSLAFLARHPVSEFTLALFNLNAFLYVE